MTAWLPKTISGTAAMFAALSLLSSGFAAPANASGGTVATQPSFSLDGVIVTPATLPVWAGVNQNSEITILFACSEVQTVTQTPGSASAVLPYPECEELAPSPNSPPGITTLTPIELSNWFFLRSGNSFLVGGTLNNHNFRHILLGSFANDGTPLAVKTASQELQVSSSSPVEAAPTPYTGPILQTPGAVAPVAQGSKVVIPGSNLSGVSKVEIGGVDAKVVVNSAGELEITVPVGLAAGTYDLVVTSDSGRLTVQDGIRVSGSAAVSETNESTARPSTKLKEDNTVKVYVFEVVGAGKVQIMFNGKEIAWVNATDANDSKLFNGYLVRTVELKAGKNVIEVFVDGERERRTVYSN